MRIATLSLPVVIIILVCNSLPGQVKVWDYPVKPGSIEWKNLDSWDQKVAACTIPQEVIQDCLTEQLLDLCFNYPMLPDILAFSTNSQKMEHLSITFNGTTELTKRTDILSVLNNRHTDLLKIVSESVLTPSEKGRISLQLLITELLILEVSGTESDTLKNNSKLSDGIALLFKKSGSKMNTSKLSKEITIFTPKGTPVKAYTVSESSDFDREYLDEYYGKAYPNARLIKTYDDRSSTRRFNCHGYAWHMSDQNNSLEKPVWIGLESETDDDIYTTDGSFIRVLSELFPGKVTWGNSSDHSAVTTPQEGVWISKWNEFPLVEHKWDDSPYGVSTFKFYASTSIKGSTANFCWNSERDFSVVDIPDATYTWNTGPGITVLSANRSLIRVASDNTYLGESWIEVTIESPLGLGNYDTQTSPVKRFWVGKPLSPENIENPAHTLCNDLIAKFNIVDSGNTYPVTYLWEILHGANAKIVKAGHPAGKTNNGSNISASNHTGKTVSIFTGNGNHLYLKVRASNSCGLSDPLVLSIDVEECSHPSSLTLLIYPNPATNKIEIVVDDSQFTGSDYDDEYNLTVTDITSKPLYTGITTGKRLTLYVSDLPKGIYFVIAKTRERYFMKKFIRL